jgi:hypothetical protein
MLYAVALQVHRSLYIFCCRESACVLRSEGWAVLRDQRPVDAAADAADAARAEAEEAAAKRSAQPAAAAGPTFSSVFDAGSWGDLGGDDDIGDLEAMLLQRDAALKPSESVGCASVAAEAPPPPAAAAPEGRAGELREYSIRHALEPARGSGSRRAAKGMTDEHIMGLVSRYMAEEREGAEDATPADARSLQLIEESMKRVGVSASDPLHICTLYIYLYICMRSGGLCLLALFDNVTVPSYVLSRASCASVLLSRYPNPILPQSYPTLPYSYPRPRGTTAATTRTTTRTTTATSAR